MNAVKDILLITSIVTVLSFGDCDDYSHGSGIKRLKRHVVSRRPKRTSYAPPPPVPFDYSDNTDGFYVLNLRLLNGICYSADSDCLDINRRWIITEFKFQLHNKYDPCFNESIELNPEKISSIQSSINEIWGVRNADDANYEWKHFGSCSLRIPELNDEFNYFKKSIELYDRFNISKILRDNNMILKGDYSIDKISDAISNVLGGKRAELGCLRGNDPLNVIRDGVDQFNEVIIFLDKQFNPIDNPGWEKYIFFNCPENVTVHYGHNNVPNYYNK